MIDSLENKKTHLVEKVRKNADNWKSLFWLDLITFAESSFFPIPPDPFQALLTLAKPKKWKLFATHVLIFSILGGIFGYIIGFWFFDKFGQPLVDFYQLQTQIDTVGDLFRTNTFWAIFISAISIIPYKVFTISAGLFSVNFITFLTASVVGRGIRFFVVGYLVSYFGKEYTEKVLKHFNAICIAVVILLILYLLIK